jgi:methylthioribose-1-phosphate isomerase
MLEHDSVRAIEWVDDKLRLLDQRRLPSEVVYLDCADTQSAAGAISAMVVRGAPAIGITAAYAVVLAAGAHYRNHPSSWKRRIETDLAELARARPTAVNLGWALQRMKGVLASVEGAPEQALLAEARLIHEEDIAANRTMATIGAAELKGTAVLTHCNTGSLATGGYGTALGVVRSAFAAGNITHVYANETRPWLQGARLTAWELVRDGIPVSVLCDGAAASLMSQGKIGWVLVGADRIAANGDVANKIGTYGLAIHARHHGLKFMVVAPSSTVDMSVPSGKDIPIETRDPEEVLSCQGHRITAQGANAWNPAFDVTPAELVDLIVTEKGKIENPTAEAMRQHMEPDR